METPPTILLDPLLDEIERFLALSRMPATMFSLAAMGDPTFVSCLRRGREVKRATRAKVLAYIDGEIARRQAS